MTEEHKQSGYAKFFKQKRKELKNIKDFGEASKMISEIWKGFTDEERSKYAEEVGRERKEILKKKASEQAQGLLI